MEGLLSRLAHAAVLHGVVAGGDGRVLSGLRPGLRRLKTLGKRMLAGMVLQPRTSALLGWCYSALPGVAHAGIHHALAKAFVGTPDAPGKEAVWRLDFAGSKIQMPLRGSDLAVDWDNLLSLLGAEREVKTAYWNWLAGPATRRPEVLLDCGASYGTHSLIWAAHGIPVIAFEPNPQCHPTFERLMAQLSQPPRLHRCALGERSGEAELRFPPNETWIGRVVPAEHESAPSATDPASGWTSTRVPVVALDDLQATIPAGRLLMKIDVEGSELATLRGAAHLIADRRPLILVESWKGPAREALFEFLEGAGYAMAALRTPSMRISDAINFLATPVAE